MHLLLHIAAQHGVGRIMMYEDDRYSRSALPACCHQNWLEMFKFSQSI